MVLRKDVAEETRWEDNIKMDVNEIDVAQEQGQAAGCYERRNGPPGSTKFGKSLD